MGGQGSKPATESVSVSKSATAAVTEAPQQVASVSEPAPENAQAAVVREKITKVVESGKSVPDLLRSGRYRVADKATTEAFYSQQPSALNRDIRVPSEVEHMTPQELKQYLTDTEGLNIGRNQMKDLSQMWRFLLASDAVQHGFDAGLLCGTFAAGITAALVPAKRHPVILLNYFIKGYAVGIFGFPLALFGWEEYQQAKVTAHEKDLFARQRSEFYGRIKEATNARSNDGSANSN
jgi:hypothetical protein